MPQMRESEWGIGPGRVVRSAWILLTTVMSVLVASSPARPAFAASRDGKERQAREACLSGDYQKGVSILSRLFVLTENPVHIFNQGRCFEQNRRYEDALARFQEFLRVAKNLNPMAREKTNQHIAECRAILDEQASLRSPSPPPPPVAAVPPQPPTVAPTETPAPSPAPASVSVATQPAREYAPSSGSGLRTAGVITTAVGGAALVAGLLLNLKVNSMSNELEQKDKYSESQDSSRKTYKTVSAISYGVGAACVATGAVLYLLGLKDHGDSAAAAGSSAMVEWTPVVAPGQLGAALQGSF